ncbi:MAG: cupredoxin domain-containing protein [Candidatus Parcubacteria bacterium]|nr:cupredoxin domain-containing protein [Candidatus Parcubacteria bacterium]
MKIKYALVAIVAVIALLAIFELALTQQKKTEQNLPPVKYEKPVITAQIRQISIKNFAFVPADMKVKKGDIVIWTNEDSAPHQIAGADFKSEVIKTGFTYSTTFTKTGKFDYSCSIHPAMKGTITVE